jgi:hypothetical protein
LRTLALLLLGLAACGDPPAPPAPPVHVPVPGQILDIGEVVFEVNGLKVGKNETDLVFARMGIPQDQITPFTDTPMGRHVLEDYALATQLYQLGVEQKLYEDPTIQLHMAFAQRQALSQAMRNKLARENVTDEAIDQWLERNKGRFDKPQVHARQILVTKESTAKELLERIQTGEDFAELARVHSTDAATAGNGGNMGWFAKGDNPLIGDAVFAHGSTNLLGPIESRMGYHVVEVLDRRQVTPKEEARALAIATLEKDAALEAMSKLRHDLKIEWTKPIADPHGAGGGAMPAEHPPVEPEEAP